MTTIGGLAKAGGVGVETVRYYQRRGLMETPAGQSGVRRYDATDVRRLRFIRQAQAAGFSLDEIADLIALDASRDRARARDLAREKIGALDAKIAELTAARTALQRLARECAASDVGPCPIIAAFEVG
ncbi:MerR family DNA-binding protein [Hephaestia sp. GCM10023244]|uniref:MerR family transcriptional regulator n=1 Tax=unclassified Hephaestia TaxID=2631281 RepID=UPI0020776066|nr:MerR family DNA-binding protein [Hephaestia sp. MAHUQ-44]MCM8729451.1 MerR family DNA-binding protein [Hephaestia sp. MAHUQ-44]